MNKQETLNKVKGGLIISCQAQPNEPLFSSFIMGKMALASTQAGAVGIRASTVIDIEEIRKNTDLPIIGIIKENYDDSKVFITPTLKEALELADANVEIIALDATDDPRPNGEKLEDIVKELKSKYPEIALMADCSKMEDVYNAEKIGFDIIGTTLFGTEEDGSGEIFLNDSAILKEIINNVKIPLIVEGHIDTPELAAKVQKLGPWAMVIGSSITRPQWIAQRFIKKIKEVENGKN